MLTRRGFIKTISILPCAPLLLSAADERKIVRTRRGIPSPPPWSGGCSQPRGDMTAFCDMWFWSEGNEIWWRQIDGTEWGYERMRPFHQFKRWEHVLGVLFWQSEHDDVWQVAKDGNGYPYFHLAGHVGVSDLYGYSKLALLIV